MNTGTEVVNYAMVLNGYTNREGAPDSANYSGVYKSGLVFLNEILVDICRIEGITFTPITSLGSTLPVSQTSIDDILPKGVAWLMAKNVGDAANEATYASLYGQKRGTAPHTKKTITNIFDNSTEE